MIWAGSELVASYFKFFKSPSIKSLIERNIITQKTCVLFCGAVMFICFMTISNIKLFFALTDIGLIFTFITTMMALLFQPAEWKSGQNIKTVLGLVTALIIFGIALQKLIESVGALFN